MVDRLSLRKERKEESCLWFRFRRRKNNSSACRWR